MKPDGSDDHEIVSGSPITPKVTDFYNNPVFSPDGSSMIFTHFLPATTDLERATATGGSVAAIVSGIDEFDFQNRADWGSAAGD